MIDMAQRLQITPEGVGELLDVTLDRADPAGKNSIVIVNDKYEVASDGTYENAA